MGVAVDAYLTGIFPRSEELIAATRGFDRRRVTKREVDVALQRDVEGLVRLQLEAGLDCLSDGLLNWQDAFRPLVEAWGGLSPGGLKRWFDNNTFFRQPVISASLEPGPISREYLQVDSLPEGNPRKAIFPGPYTFSDLAEDHHYSQPTEVIPSVARCLAHVCREMKGLGYTHIQFSEPSLAVNPPSDDLLEVVRQAYEILRGVDGLQLSLHLFFSPTGSLLPDLLDFPVDAIGLDLYEEDLSRLKDVDFDKILGCGCIDGRNSLLETPEEIVDLASRVLDALSPTGLILCPNTGLEFLPRSVAVEKVRSLGQARTQLEEVG
ncbi:MAG: hypothetical protein V3U52_08175 [Thermoplasmata archaeon]